ncbi:unnamed protein product [Amaranthus hypochondriacus]
MNSSERERRVGWRFLGFSKNFYRNSNLNFKAGKRRGFSRFSGYNGPSWSGQRPFHGFCGGLWGVSRHHGWSGPPEQPHTGFGSRRIGVFSLFVDGICSSTSITALRLFFKGIGVVVDAFISRKSRPSRKDRFGFVRFRYREEAVRAIKELHGQRLDGGMFLISMAKYKRGGIPFKSGSSFKRVFSPSIDGSRGDEDCRPGKKDSTSSPVPGKIDTPILSTIEALTNGVPVSELRICVTGENAELSNIKLDPPQPVQAGNDSCYKEGTTISETLVNGTQNTVGASMPKDSSESVVGLVHGSTLQQRKQKSLGLKQSELDLATGAKIQSKACGKLKRIQNHRDIAMFLGFYSNSKEVHA